jgi:hypothetical protein
MAAGHRDAVAMTILHSCRLAGLNPTDYLTRVTPTLLLHRRGRQQDLVTLTPVTLAGTRKGSRSRYMEVDGAAGRIQCRIGRSRFRLGCGNHRDEDHGQQHPTAPPCRETENYRIDSWGVRMVGTLTAAMMFTGFQHRTSRHRRCGIIEAQLRIRPSINDSRWKW